MSTQFIERSDEGATSTVASPPAPTISRPKTSYDRPEIPIGDRIIRVLVVHDQMLVRAGLRAVLEASPDISVVGEAATGDSALALAEQVHPDVVILDLDMPGDEAITTTRSLTAHDVHPTVLVLTMHPEDERIIEALRSGANGYLTKDLAQPELASALRSAAAGDVYVRPQAGRLLAATLRRTTPHSDTEDARARYEMLSDREQTVLRLVAEGYSGPQIGRSLGITAKTVDTYKQRIQQKIGLSSRAGYIRFALSIDLLKK